MQQRHRLTYLLAAIAGILLTGGICYAAPVTLQVSATIPSNHKCTFNSNTPIALNFDTLNPLSGANVTRTATIDFECKGNKNIPVIYGVSDDDGLNETGSNANRMKHGNSSLVGPSAFIPYTFSVSPTNGTTPLKTPVTLTITGTILGSSYQTAYATALGESYTDTVIVSIDP